MKRLGYILLSLLAFGLTGTAQGQAAQCPVDLLIIPYVEGLMIPVKRPPDHCVEEVTDSDGDGMADSWELAWFRNLTSANGEGYLTDADGDGISDLEEYERGGNPTVDDASAFLAANRCQQKYLPFGETFNSDDCGQIKHAGSGA